MKMTNYPWGCSVDASVTDNCDHAIPSLSSVQLCQFPTFELYYKNKQSKVKLDIGGTASVITESVCRSAGIPILPATQRAIQADGQSCLQIIGHRHSEEIPPLHLTALVLPKLGCEILEGMPFIMSNQIIIHQSYIHNKYDLNFSSKRIRSDLYMSPLILYNFMCLSSLVQWKLAVIKIIEIFQCFATNESLYQVWICPMENYLILFDFHCLGLL